MVYDTLSYYGDGDVELEASSTGTAATLSTTRDGDGATDVRPAQVGPIVRIVTGPLRISADLTGSQRTPSRWSR